MVDTPDHGSTPPPDAVMGATFRGIFTTSHDGISRDSVPEVRGKPPNSEFPTLLYLHNPTAGVHLRVCARAADLNDVK